MSATYTTPEASAATPAGLLKEAAAPWPSAKDALPLPAKVVTFQMHGGSALSPAVAQFAGVKQGMLPAAPPVQYDPAGHCVSKSFTQEYPGAASEGQPAKAPPTIIAKAHSQKGRGGEPPTTSAEREVRLATRHRRASTSPTENKAEGAAVGGGRRKASRGLPGRERA